MCNVWEWASERGTEREEGEENRVSWVSMLWCISIRSHWALHWMHSKLNPSLSRSLSLSLSHPLSVSLLPSLILPFPLCLFSLVSCASPLFCDIGRLMSGVCGPPASKLWRCIMSIERSNHSKPPRWSTDARALYVHQYFSTLVHTHVLPWPVCHSNMTLIIRDHKTKIYQIMAKALDNKDVVLCSGLKKSSLFYVFRKYNILRVYCKNFRPKYEIFTKLQYIVESAPRLINLI